MRNRFMVELEREISLTCQGEFNVNHSSFKANEVSDEVYTDGLIDSCSMPNHTYDVSLAFATAIADTEMEAVERQYGRKRLERWFPWKRSEREAIERQRSFIRPLNHEERIELYAAKIAKGERLFESQPI